MASEKASLIQHVEVIPVKKNSIPGKHLIIMPALFFLMLGANIQVYIVNEWTQYYIRTDLFPNMTEIHNFFACHEQNHSSENYHHYKTVQQTSSLWIAVYSTAQLIPTFFTSMILPSYTDTYGRRFLFILSSLGMLIRYILMSVIIHFKRPLSYVTVIYAIDGLTGTTYSILSVTFSYIADLTKEDNQRVTCIVVMEVIMAITSVTASIFSGYMIETSQLGFFYTSIIAAFIAFIGFFLFAFLLPESLDKNHREKRKPFIAMFKRSTEFYYSGEFKGKRLCYVLLLLCFTFGELSGLNRTSLETLYFLGQPFCWGPSEIGIFSMVRQSSKSLVAILSLKVFQFCMSNQAIAILSSLSNAASYIVEARATNDVMIYMVPVAGMFSLLTVPMIRGIMSAMTMTDKQGALFASMASIQVVCNLVTSFIQNGIYAATISYMNGFVFLILAGFSFINFIFLIMFCFVKPYHAKGNQSLKHDFVHNTKV